MTRKFGITGEVPHQRHFPWQILLIGVAFVLVASSLVGSYFAFWRSSTPAIIPPKPSQGGVILPASKETPTPKPTPTDTSKLTSTPLPIIEAEWETNGPLPGGQHAGFIEKLVVHNDGEILFILESQPGAKILWQSQDGGRSWQKKEDVFPGQNQKLSPNEKKKIKEKFESEVFPVISLGLPQPKSWMFVANLVVDPNNTNNILILVTVLEIPPHPVSGPRLSPEEKEKYATLKLNTNRLFLSLDGGNSWLEVNVPPGTKHPDSRRPIALISSDNQLKLYFCLNLTVWQAKIDLKSLTPQ